MEADEELQQAPDQRDRRDLWLNLLQLLVRPARQRRVRGLALLLPDAAVAGACCADGDACTQALAEQLQALDHDDGLLEAALLQQALSGLQQHGQARHDGLSQLGSRGVCGAGGGLAAATGVGGCHCCWSCCAISIRHGFVVIPATCCCCCWTVAPCAVCPGCGGAAQQPEQRRQLLRAVSHREQLQQCRS